MAHVREDLLTPTLSAGHRPVRLYSPTALFYTSFFGGPVAAIAFSWLNSQELRRTKDDLRWYVLAALASVAWIGGVVYAVDVANMIPADMLGSESRTGRYLIRGFGLVVWGGFYFMHRPMHRTNTMVGAEPLNPWKAAIGCIVAAMVVQWVIVAGAKVVLG
ncbi:hypothetical protein FIV42_14990 [Persicimonas caeni]|uniref:Uncharacterized protein n=1 Tax=Persicimonas caeni TaxID=2292766 RepID=A0A4Y6PVI1_PERCE|nr:hypothetical protein [Persicimonas caeni]QDG51997.1 hypothetical protein FIV42_14990 [Persicimonas caeni]QED33218.1 hypothetical protein FRD00_14985 [Persicimonas caeni]